MSIGPSGEFNARFINPESVARQFVHTPEFAKLAHSRHSVLLGPRGCGKTTLLKMLTGRAIYTWRNERQSGEDYRLPIPQFESIYIPTDVRWSYELASVGGKVSATYDRAATLLQRVITSAAVMAATVEAFAFLLRDDAEVSLRVCKELIALWGLADTAPVWGAIQGKLDVVASDVRGVVNRGDEAATNEFIRGIQPRWIGHVLDLAPDWLRNEVREFRFEYPLRDFVTSFHRLRAVARMFARDGAPVLAPLGPKIFALSCFVVAMVEPGTSVWRVSAGPREGTNDRKGVWPPVTAEVRWDRPDDVNVIRMSTPEAGRR